MQTATKTMAAVITVAMGAGFSTCAVAQSTVAIYGVMDTFLTNIHADGPGSVLRMDSSGLLASRIGFKGSEDLGGGYQTSFALEAGLNSDDGSAADTRGRLFSRQAWVGIGTPFGEVRLGRQNTPQFYMNGRFDAFNGATQASGWNNMFGAVPRVDNQIGYFSPNMHGLKLQAMVGRGGSGGGPIVDEVAANQNVHLAAEYESGPFYVGINHEVINSSGVQTRRTGLGTSYALSSAWDVFAATDHETASNGNLDTNLYSVSARYGITPSSSLAFGYAATHDKLSGTGHGNADELSALYRYLLSKRTTIYTGISRISQSDLRASFSLNGAAVVAPGSQVKSSPGGAINGVQIGITHTF